VRAPVAVPDAVRIVSNSAIHPLQFTYRMVRRKSSGGSHVKYRLEGRGFQVIPSQQCIKKCETAGADLHPAVLSGILL
jgi:hypothetical protein